MELLVFAGLVAAAFALQPAPTPDRIILLPDRDGSVGSLEVSTATGTQEIVTPYAALAITPKGQLKAYNEDANALRTRHQDLLAAQPATAKSYQLYFETGGNTLTAESRLTLEALKADAQGRSAPEIRVIGHTDRVGSDEANEALSQRRAETIVDFLREAGVTAVSFEAVGMGERTPLVPTEDGVAEARNRRVEVAIR